MTSVDPTADFNVESLSQSGVTVVAVRGELDIATVPSLRDEMDQHPDERLVLDLCDVSFMDSSALAEVLRRHRTAQDGFAIACQPKSAPRRVFGLVAPTGLPLHETREDAVRSLGEGDG